MFDFSDIDRELGAERSHKCEQVWHDLILVDALQAGLAAADVHWDHRTTVRDGGRDVVVERGAQRPGSLFLPDTPTVFSIKSGENGLETATLRNELDPVHHASLASKLTSGASYRYCVVRPANLEQRERLRAEADKSASRLGIPPERIVLLFTDHLIEGLKWYPGSLQRHFPRIASARGKTCLEWGQPRPSFDPTVAFVEFGDRAQLRDQIREHLRSTSGDEVLHIAGLSGIGKTRLVLEACRDEQLEATVLYYASFVDVYEMLQRIKREENLSIRIVVDECSFREYDSLRDALAGFGARVRAVSIGPARANDRSSGPVLILRPPEAESGILAVLKSHARDSVSAPALKRIADQSAHDLRFALLLLSAVQSDPSSADFGSMALLDTRKLYNRVLSLFDQDLASAPEFAVRYPILTFGRHVGVAPPRRQELEFLARAFEVSVSELDRTVAAAVRCGLGDQPAHLFEAVPRGMATRIFADELWPQIKNRFEDLFRSAPDDSFRRAIMQRVELCPSDLREEVTSRVDVFFRGSLGLPSLEALSQPTAARTIRAWAELSPEAGLTWLGEAVGGATIEHLRQFGGSAGIPSAAGARREVVWLAGHMSCFREHYVACERILFMLGLAENEKIGNNASAIWAERHRIILSNAETPYSERIEILLTRLEESTLESLGLLMEGVREAISGPHSVMLPPPVVGGRLVPREWRPIVNPYTLWVDVIRKTLAVLSCRPAPVQAQARRTVIAHLHLYFKEDTIDDLRKFLGLAQEDEEERTALQRELENLRARLLRDDDAAVRALGPLVATWLAEVAPTRLADRIKSVLGRNLWEYNDLEDASERMDSWKPVFLRLAEEIKADPGSLLSLEEWLSVSNRSGSWGCGIAMAESSDAGEFDSLISDWLRRKRCTEVCRGFLYSRHLNHGAIPRFAVTILDDLVGKSPDYVAETTQACDPTEAGFARILRCVEVPGIDFGRNVRMLYGPLWERVLTGAKKAQLLDPLWPVEAPRVPEHGQIAMHLLEMYSVGRHGAPMEPEIMPIVERLVLEPPPLDDTHALGEWKDLALEVSKSRLVDVIRLCARLAVDVESSSYPCQAAIQVLTRIGPARSAETITSIVTRLRDQEHWPYIHLQEWQRLMASLDATAIGAYIEREGVELARRVAQLMPDPAVTSDGKANLPAITAWFLSMFGDDADCFDEFMVGRWNGKVRMGYAWQRQGEIDLLERAYSQHPVPSVRRWLIRTLQQHDEEVRHDRISYEEMNNRA